MSRSKRLRSIERRDLLREATQTLKGLSIEQLRNLRFEVGRELNQQQTVINDLRLRLDAVMHEIAGRDQEWDGYRITDHAVLRYLERHKGMNVDAVRQEIAEMVKASKGVDLTRRRHEGMKTTIGVDERDGFKAVTTVYHEEELAVMTLPGRGLRDDV
jgi:hypothetical protein